MNYMTLEEAMQEVNGSGEVEPLSVYATLEQIKDGRHKRGVHYSVALILTLILLGKLAGMTTLQGIAEWVLYREGWLRQVLPEQPKRLPCAATYSNVLREVNAEEVRAVINDLLTRIGAVARCGEEPRHEVREAEHHKHVHVALDDKTLRGTLSHEAADQQKMHQLALYARTNWNPAQRIGNRREAE